MTPAQEDLLAQLTEALRRDTRVQAIWLSGSLGRGEGDAWSDVDLVAQVDPTHIFDCVAHYKRPQAGFPETVLAFDVHGVIVSAVTPDWRRFDIHFASPAHVAGMGADAWRLLHGEVPPPAPVQAPPADDGAARRVAALATEFLRVLGLLPVAVGREEWLVAQQGFGLLRQMLVDLMLEENGTAGAARGVKRLNGFLTPEQQAELEAIVPPAASRDAIVTANADLARAFLARARPLAARLGVAWPEAFEAATCRHLEAAVGLTL